MTDKETAVAAAKTELPATGDTRAEWAESVPDLVTDKIRLELHRKHQSTYIFYRVLEAIDKNMKNGYDDCGDCRRCISDWLSAEKEEEDT